MSESEVTRRRRLPIWFYRVLNEINDILENVIKNFR